MKSKFFGFNAKYVLAIALLAISGAVFTSCYETEGEDLPLPGKTLPATYTISGQVTDFVTKAAIPGATLSFSPAVQGNTPTEANGRYEVTTQTAGTQTVTVSASGYTTQTATVQIAALTDGQAATYFLDFALLPEGYTPPEVDMVLLDTELGRSIKTFKADEIDQVDHVYTQDNKGNVSLKITVDSGVVIDDNWADGISNEFKSAIEAKLTEFYNVAPKSVFEPFAYYYKIVLPVATSLESVTVETFYETNTFEFKFGIDTHEVVVISIPDISYDHALRSNAFGHGKGHGHGHGDNLNAGGGIFEPI